MVEWINSLELQTWFVNIFSGNLEIFTLIAIISIIGIVAVFKMTQISLLLFIGIFVFMFKDSITPYIYVLLAIVGGLVVAFTLNKILNKY